ncbi:MAG: hypothetical protein COZ15_01770 [Elusimicrobia bacterium CG_4_10_14_3_um_filter_49_12_50_7]|nr:MAG: hypothetical protein COS41_04775 [Elusimicrobia bacterium CG03_land_8_20_14_0_80_50_18]PIX16399.1 MAG: hypothetical protein COZ72_01075 [Elusimicrobia bacterium CG_4_8_14_3_um_filter_50_9]PIY17858.1 MAG: hypothetical protein COZ15_01770 [Elusimicrobia bacterium CG_4_10_14_3_um_filter_49_12_50_7]
MVTLKTFRPYIYAGPYDKSAFIAPPYDIISAADQKTLYRRHKRNVVRLVLGRKYPSDDGRRNSFSRAADFFRRWREGKNIIRGEEGIFLLTQDFELSGKKYSRAGIVARLDWSKTSAESIIPHEKTHRKHRLDRSRLLKKLPVNFSPIFLITEGVSRRIKKALTGAKKESFYSIPGEKAALYRIQPKIGAELLSFLGKKKFVIADGHHRLRVSRENFEKDGSAKYLMVYICDFSDESCVILSHDDRKTTLDKNKIREVLKTGKLMRQKSTFFWPKLPSGLLMHPVKEDRYEK